MLGQTLSALIRHRDWPLSIETKHWAYTRVYKVGSRTGLTAGKVVNLSKQNFDQFVKPYDSFSDTFYIVGEDAAFIDEGDSGALVYFEEKGQLVPLGIIRSYYLREGTQQMYAIAVTMSAVMAMCRRVLGPTFDLCTHHRLDHQL